MKSLFIACIALFFSTNLYANLIVHRELSFGSIVVRGNDVVSSVVIPRVGAPYATNKIIILEKGHPGEYTLTGFLPSTPVQLMTNLPALLGQAGVSAQFHVTSADLPVNTAANGLGELHLKVGGVLQTSGNSMSYEDGVYSGSFDIQVNF
ncbi:MAG: DUF4402 domain-containing protein [Gammaproteobacteria bacterium]|nr:DUF4402 domain-containing protein [Gammaproteobacteria bacterium]MBU2058334.1 DUF4402 domain-containing protein [Gammaproteobacteria bacterium]MBU2176613.1 DUF4402 domain-containing protein [Gammaproteobacteria bacterium]MBU2248445.1 DUF4402 domain-containing protein [Gammaproteobacteria bacterium]MBU2345692.1 DUF4402 domain-containing protein [Gammaproteobacteria bacterium]